MFGKVNEDSFRDILLESTLFFGNNNNSENRFGLSNNQPLRSSFEGSTGNTVDDLAKLLATKANLGSNDNDFNGIWNNNNVRSNNPNDNNADLLAIQSSISKLWNSNNADNASSQQQSRPAKKQLLNSVQQQQQQPPLLPSAAAIAAAAAAAKVNTSRYKTELCRPFAENGSCKYGEKCQFAHGQVELRSISRHPKYKTDLCRTYHTSGFCPYGPRCHFIHNLEEAKKEQQLQQQQEQQQQSVLSNSSSTASLNQSQLIQLSLQLQAAMAAQNNQPSFPMFSTQNSIVEQQQRPFLRLRNLSESDFPSSSSASSTTSSSPLDLESDLETSVPSFFPSLFPSSTPCSSPLRASALSPASPQGSGRLPVFATLRK